MFINDYVMTTLQKGKEAEMQQRDHHRRVLAEVISEYKSDRSRRKPRRR
jgi:hypothetical protein